MKWQERKTFDTFEEFGNYIDSLGYPVYIEMARNSRYRTYKILQGYATHYVSVKEVK